MPCVQPSQRKQINEQNTCALGEYVKAIKVSSHRMTHRKPQQLYESSELMGSEKEERGTNMGLPERNVNNPPILHEGRKHMKIIRERKDLDC